MATPGLEYWDHTEEMPDLQVLMSAAAGHGVFTGPAGASVPEAIVGASSWKQVWNSNAAPSWAYTLPAPVDLTARALAVFASIIAPEQNVYWTGLLTADYHVGIDSSLTLAPGHTYPAGPTENATLTTINVGGALIHAASYDSGTGTFSGLTVISGLNQTVPAGTRVCTGSGVAIPSLSLTLRMAASAATVGVRWEGKWLGGGHGGWGEFIAVTGGCDPVLGPEVVPVGGATPSLLDHIQYLQLVTTLAAPAGLPRTDYDGVNDFRGPQPGPHGFEFVWNGVGSFARERRTVIACSFDDARYTPIIASQEGKRPRPGAPNGVGPVSHMLLCTNVEEGDASIAAGHPEGDVGFLTTRMVQNLAEDGDEMALHAYDRERHHQDEDNGGFGPLPRHEARAPDNALLSLTDSIRWLRDRGVHAAAQGGITHAMPLSSSCGEHQHGWEEWGIVASRSLSDGGAQPIVTGGATNAAECVGFTKSNTYRFLAWPLGDRNHLVSMSTLSNLALIKTGGAFTIGSKVITGTSGLSSLHEGCQIINVAKIPDGTVIESVVGSTVTMSKPALAGGPVGSTAITVGDKRGHRAAMRAVYEACCQGLSLSIHSHAQEEDGTSFTESRWSRTMWREFFDYCLDLQLGTNTYGDNPALHHFPGLRVVTLLELVTGFPPERPVIDDWGMAA